ncbi:MAG TPA: hypothetical protein VIB49_04815 [Thermoplasmata archaeon]|jgi:hypothetical protein
MADLGSVLNEFFGSIVQNPVYLMLSIAGVALLLILIVARHIHKIHSQEIFVHQAWGANWKGR